MMGAFFPAMIAIIGVFAVAFVLAELMHHIAQADPSTFNAAAEQTVTTAEPALSMPPEIAGAVFLGAVAYVGVLRYGGAVDFDRYGLTTIGTYPRVEHADATETGVACRECRRDLVAGDRAERRDYWQDVVVCGVVVRRRDRQTVHYCEDHANAAVRDELTPLVERGGVRLPDPSDPDSDRERTWETSGGSAVADGGALQPSDAVSTTADMGGMFFLTILVVPVALAIAVIARLFGMDVPAPSEGDT